MCAVNFVQQQMQCMQLSLSGKFRFAVGRILIFFLLGYNFEKFSLEQTRHFPLKTNLISRLWNSFSLTGSLICDNHIDLNGEERKGCLQLKCNVHLAHMSLLFACVRWFSGCTVTFQNIHENAFYEHIERINLN